MRSEVRQERALGPYPHGRGFRVILVAATGARRAVPFASETEARAFKDEFAAETDSRTLTVAVDEYIAHLRDRGLKDRTVTTVWHRLRGLLRVAERDRSLRSLTPAVALQLLEQRRAPNTDPVVPGKRRRKPACAETQKGELAEARAFASWCIAKGWMKKDPFVGLEPVGERRRGKPKLRIDEARKLLEAALGEGSDEGLAVAIALLMGLRASEITDRVVRDVDDGARVLWIERAKTRKGDRQLEVPEVLRAPLAALVAGRGGGEPLWRDADRDRHWVAYHVRRLCRAAKVPAVPPHGLRDTQASIAARAQPVELVAAALGHASPEITRRHYLDAGAEADGRSRAATLRVLAGGAR
jgi:integrase